MTTETEEVQPLLPRKLSELIRIAVEDAQKAEKEGHVLRMDYWFNDGPAGKCSVCLAGAVMLMRLDAEEVAAKEGEPIEELSPLDFGSNCEPLHAVDGAREGDLISALASLGLASFRVTYDHLPSGVRQARDLIKKGFDIKLRRAHWSTYLKAADILESVGY